MCKPVSSRLVQAEINERLFCKGRVQRWVVEAAETHKDAVRKLDVCMPPNLGLQAASRTAEANEERRRVEAEKNALALKASMLAPQLAALEEGRATLEGFQREGVCFA